MATTQTLSTGYHRPAIGAVPGGLHFRSIPDPLRLQIEGTELKKEKQLRESVIFNWCARAHDCLSFLAATDPSRIWTWEEQVLPILLASDFLKRCREQPRGHAGDYLTMQMMYDGTPSSKNRFGQIVDAWSMSQPCAKAVRNGVLRVRTFVQKVCTDFGNAPISIASLGCGPAAEVFDLCDASSIHFTLVDMDKEALDYITQKAAAKGIASRMRTVKANVIKMVTEDRDQLPQRYAGFYSLGLIDYFSDELVVHLLDLIHSKLAPSGSVLLANFRPGHPNAALFERAMKWSITPRSKSQLLRLVQRSKFANCPVTVASEQEGVLLFVECKKLPA